MKKLLGLILVLILIFAFTADAMAARPKITKQPETAVTNKKGDISFSIKTSGDVSAIIWHFIDPVSGTDVTGTKLQKAVKGVKVSNPTNKTIKLYRVPESMHGWTVYCHVNGNGYGVDSDHVTLYVYGLEMPSDDSTPSVPQETEAPSETMPPSEQESKNKETVTDKAPAGEKDNSAKEETVSPAESVSPDSTQITEVPDKVITVTCSAKALRMLDSSENSKAGEPVSQLQFTNIASFIVTSDEPIKSWTINGVRFEADNPVNEFTITNATQDISLTLTTSRKGASVELDESRMCKVTCIGCTFTYIRGGLRSVTEGEVPAGAPINIIADSSDLALSGYSINGGDPVSIGLGSFRFIVSEDVTISLGH